jgi:hypothetical protein
MRLRRFIRRRLRRFFVKKRRHRRSVSPRYARAWETAFFAVLFLIGVAGFGALFWGRILPEWQVNHDFVKHECVVLDKRIGAAEFEDASLVENVPLVDTVPITDGTMKYRPEILIEYKVDSRKIRIWTYDIQVLEGDGGYREDHEEVKRAIEHFVVGRRHVCWYDPEAPQQAVLAKRGPLWDGWSFSIPLSLVVLGALGALYHVWTWNMSREHKAVAAQRRAESSKRREPPDDETTPTKTETLGNHEKKNGEQKYPGVPSEDRVTDSPGTTLNYRLPVQSSSGFQTVLLATIAGIWNLIVFIMALIFFRELWASSVHWGNILVLIPLSAFGIWLLLYSFRRTVTALGVGPAWIEISDHPLRPGESYEILVNQTGRLTMRRFQVVLACEEETTFRQGTNARLETQRAFETVLLERESFSIRPHEPFESSCRMDLPEDVMHSFTSEKNRIVWKLIVSGEPEGWPPFERDFPVIVYPLEENGRNAEKSETNEE